MIKSTRVPERADVIMAIFEKARQNGFIIPETIKGMDIEVCWPIVVFRHDFAQAFFQNELKWQHFLQTMAIQEDPIDYLSNFL